MMLGNNSLKIEAVWTSPSLAGPNPLSVDTFIIKNRIPTLVVNDVTYPLIRNAKITRNSNYKLIVELDKIGRLYGTGKIKNLHDFDLVNGLELTLTKGRSKVELINEIKAINNIVTPTGVELRFALYMQYGSDYVKTCFDALASSGVTFHMLNFIWASQSESEKKILFELIKSFRQKIGKNSFKAKIPLINNFSTEPNIFYSMSIDEIVQYNKKENKKENDEESSEESSESSE